MRQGRTIIRGNGHTLAFLHIPRCGGRSVERALGFMPSHLTAKVAHERYPDLTGTFAVLRNPFTLLISWYNVIGGYEEDVEEFRAWIAAGHPTKGVLLEDGTKADPLDQPAWIEEDTAIFLYPDLQLAAGWAARQTGKTAQRVPEIGAWHKQRDWREYYDRETGRLVLREYREFVGQWGFEQP